MPRGDTDVPHVAFTHHRVGLHKAGGPAPAAGTIPDLVAIAEGPAWSEIDRKRNLGLAHLEVYREPAYAQYGDVFRERAKELLEAVYDVGLREAETCQALAEIYSRDDLARASDYAKQALTCRDILPDARAGALTVLAYAEMQEKRFETAAEFFEQLTQLRRYADDWRLLGVCYLELSQPKKALMALDKSLAIRPSRHATHAAAAEACRRLGDQARAADHDQKAKWLLANGRD
jgi:tetratricopeptide (TPR) repeat protein